MSGGSYDYAYHHIEMLAEDIRPTTTLRRAFKKHLRLVAKACRDIEWVDSDDCAAGEEDDSIKACLHMSSRLESAIDEAKEHMVNLGSIINEAERLKK